MVIFSTFCLYLAVLLFAPVAGQAIDRSRHEFTSFDAIDKLSSDLQMFGHNLRPRDRGLSVQSDLSAEPRDASISSYLSVFNLGDRGVVSKEADLDPRRNLLASRSAPTTSSNAVKSNNLAFVYPTLDELDAVGRLLDKSATAPKGEPVVGGQTNSHRYPQGFVRAKTAKELFGLDPSGSSCSPLFMSVTDLGTAWSDVQRPQVYISGEIHGDERIGPMTSLHVARLLALAADCETSERASGSTSTSSSTAACDTMRASYPDISPRQVEWLAFLAMRRDTLISPATNCMGYLHVERTDGGVDPNRDFSYGRGTDTNCFLSATARVIREIFRHELIQSVVTFHGGMVAIGYEWGAPHHPYSSPTGKSSSSTRRDISPDDAVHRDIAKQMAANAGSFKRVKAYPYGTINSLVYPVAGGMEDWVYASAWDPEHDRGKGLDVSASLDASSICRGIRSERSNATKAKPVPSGRAAVFLIETSDAKIPEADTLGCAAGLIRYDTPLFPFVQGDRSAENAAASRGRACDGHVSRNIRLSLTAIDFAQPYVCIGTQPSVMAHKSDRSTSSSSGGFSISLDWYVGGGEAVDSTWLSWHHSPLSIDGAVEDRGGAAVQNRRVLQRRRRKLRGKTGGKRSSGEPTSSKKQRESVGVSGIQSGLDWATAFAKRDVAYLNTDAADWTRILDVLNPHYAPDYLGSAGTHSSQANVSGSNHSSSVYSGTTIWSSNGNASSSSFTTSIEVPRHPMAATIRATLSNANDAFVAVSNASSVTLESVAVYWLVAWARVDSHWAVKHPLSSPPELSPQTHLANARTNPDWNYVGSNTNPASKTTSSAGGVSGLRSALHGRPREVRGRLYWPSDPIIVAVRYSHLLKPDSISALSAISLFANRTSGQSRTSSPGGQEDSPYPFIMLPRRDILSTRTLEVRVVSVVKHCAFWKRA